MSLFERLCNFKNSFNKCVFLFKVKNHRGCRVTYQPLSELLFLRLTLKLQRRLSLFRSLVQTMSLKHKFQRLQSKTEASQKQSEALKGYQRYFRGSQRLQEALSDVTEKNFKDYKVKQRLVKAVRGFKRL